MNNETESGRLNRKREQERRDEIILRGLRGKTQCYSASRERTVMLEQGKFSPLWLLFYAQARMAGVACRNSSGCYANIAVYYGATKYEDHTWELRDDEHNTLDLALLWAAHQLITEHKRAEMAPVTLGLSPGGESYPGTPQGTKTPLAPLSGSKKGNPVKEVTTPGTLRVGDEPPPS